MAESSGNCGLPDGVIHLHSERCYQAGRQAAVADAVDELVRLNTIGGRRFDQSSDDEIAWFNAHPLRSAGSVPLMEVIPALVEWLQGHETGGVAGTTDVHNHGPYRPVCNERRLCDGQLRGACLDDDGSSR